MTETAFQELVGRSYQRLSSHQLDFISVNTKYSNKKKRRGTYYFELPLVYFDETETRRIICELMFNPTYRKHFIHHTLTTDPETVDQYIDELLTSQQASRNQTLLRILDESVIQEEPITEIKQGIANAVKSIKYWNFQSGKAHYRIRDLGTIYLRPLREE